MTVFCVSRFYLAQFKLFFKKKQLRRDALAGTCSPSLPMNQQGASPLRFGYEEEHVGLLHKVDSEQLSEIEHHYNDEAESWQTWKSD